MKLDKYTLTARLYPALITTIPILLFTLNCKVEGIEELFNSVLKAKILGNITISVVAIYLLMQSNRFFGKFLFEKVIFKNESDMPTTRFLLYRDKEFSDEYKDRIRSKVLTDFNFILPNRVDEVNNIENSRKRIVEGVGLIRNKVKNGNLLLQFNIEYGFARNLIGGSIIALIVSIWDLIYFITIDESIIMYISIILAFFFSACLLLSKPIINTLGTTYAKRLFQEYAI